MNRRSAGTGLSGGTVIALAAAPVAFVAVFFGWPVATIVSLGLSAGGIADVLSDPGLRRVAWFTLWQATASTAITLVTAMPAAFVLARYRFAGRRAALAMVTVPFVLPTVVVGTAFLALLPDRLHGTVWAVLAAHVFFNVAVVVRTVGALWGHLDPRLEDAARVLGAPRWRVFTEVTLPLLRPAIAAAASIVFLFTFTSFGVVLLLGGPRHPTIEVEIFRLTTQMLDLPASAALAMLQMVFVAALLYWWSRSQERHSMSLRLQPSSIRRPVRTMREKAMVVGILATTLVFLMLPLARLVERSFATRHGYGLAFYRALVDGGRGSTADVAPLDSLVVSLRYAALTAVLGTALGVLAACAIAYGRWGGRLLDTGLMLPLGTSAVTVGFGLLITFDESPLDWRGRWFIIPIAHTLVATPFVVRAVLPVLRSIEPRLRDAAATLGASRWATWREVDVPMVGRSAVVGAGFAFAVSLGEFGATTFLARTGTPTVPLQIASLLGRPGELNTGQAYALSVILMAVTAAAILAVDRLRADSESTF
ncbi:MAG TPA: iron ABC transporter permease [Acidimicrobiales bacterium]